MPSSGVQKAIYTLESPYPSPIWPEISPSIEQAILDLLLPILESIGQSRLLPASKGKKRKKKAPSVSTDQVPSILPPSPLPFWPVTIGFNTTIDRLETLSRLTVPVMKEEEEDVTKPKSLCAVFASYSTLPSIMTSSLPVLATMASASRAEEPAVRLIPLTEQSTSQLAQVLKQPRLGLLGLERDYEGSAALESLIISSIEPVQVPWVTQRSILRYLPVKIHKQDVTQNPDKQRKKRKKADKVTS